ncbi:CDP-glycerol glycerophosphotransferase family protein [Peribacillus sp. SCS-37]|uniref:CDP-glycerol glycerophosphotransferase family protein n=1 Tax=Paraperibacillus esterisolvens TaxID=3115296 RepID=UPI0039062F3E
MNRSKKILSVLLRNRGNLPYKLLSTKVFRLLYKLFCRLPIDEKKVVFASDSRLTIGGNFEFVLEELKKQDPGLSYYFLFKNGTGVKKSAGEIISLAYHLATAKNILLDDFYPMVYPLKIRKGAELIQLWHAVGAFKTFGYSRAGKPGGPSLESKNHRNYTKAIVSSQEVAEHYAEGFGIPLDRVVATGIPRTDIFFNESYKEQVVDRLHREFPYLRDKKVILFAPTFRGNGQQTAFYPTEVLNIDSLYNELKDDYVFLFKMHPFVKDFWEIPEEYEGFFHDFTSYREINDLLFAADILITDYSSVCFEFALLDKPMLFFAPDVEEYIEHRDFYYNYYEFIPGPLVRTTGELISTIQNGQFRMDRVDSFIKHFFDHMDGQSSRRVAELILDKRLPVRKKT